ncbi:MAG: glutamate 5-kinase [Polyangiales bacterium]
MSEATSLDRAALLGPCRTVVVKIGSGVLTDPRGGIDPAVLDGIAAEVADLAAQRRRVVVVSSGAIALGREALGFTSRPRRMDQLQACAAAGQGRLIRLWSEALGARGKVVAQVLLTHSDFADRSRYLNARGAMEALLARGAVPVINENDTVSVDEIAFGDNDSLSAQVANLLKADALVMLSVAPGLLDGDARVPVVAAGDRAVDAMVRAGTSSVGTGGMVTKLRAARAASDAGATAVIAPGRQPGVLSALFRGEDVGTVFLPSVEPVGARAHWIAHTLRPRGALVVDEGARRAVRDHKRSLLPSGVVEVRGAFERGDPVDLVGPDGDVFARGLSAFSSADMQRARGLKSSALAEVLGAAHGEEAVHKDDLALLG